MHSVGGVLVHMPHVNTLKYVKLIHNLQPF